MKYIGYLYALAFSDILLLILIGVLTTQKSFKGQSKKAFTSCLVTMFIWTSSLIFQILFQKINVDPAIFEGFAAFGACFICIAIFALGIIFDKTKIKIRRIYSFLFIIPILSTLLMFTNNLHHLFYEVYSVKLNETIFGPYFYVHSAYSYTLIIIGLVYLLKYSIKNSGFFSKQSILILVGISIPVIVNIIGTLGIVNMTVYVTPISFVAALFFISIAIFKYGFLKVSPIALQRIVDIMSDAYVVLNDDLIVTDFNHSFLKLFNTSSHQIRNASFIDLVQSTKTMKSNAKAILKAVDKSKSKHDSTIRMQEYLKDINKYFNIEISSITYNNNFLGTLILLKDVTQHITDMQTIQDKQDRLIEKERLASLGQMIGGIAHNLKTPIMSISGAAEGISDLIQEYEMSVGNPEVTAEDHKAIAEDMRTWITKIRTHLSYMSDIITAVKGQAVNFADNTFNGFTIGELVKYVDILMKHELKNSLITLHTNVSLPEDTKLSGNINSLVQVVNNIISNAIQAYNGKPNKDIVFDLTKEHNNLVMKIQDFAGGLPKEVQDKLFKEMITTKGKNGTGLGLFMSYSNIKGHFNGDMSFKVDPWKGTTFIITIPI